MVQNSFAAAVPPNCNYNAFARAPGCPPPQKKKRKKEKKKKKKKKTHNNTKHNHRLRCAALAPSIDLGGARTPRRWSVARALEITAIDGTGCVGAGTKSAG